MPKPRGFSIWLGLFPIAATLLMLITVTVSKINKGPSDLSEYGSQRERNPAEFSGIDPNLGGIYCQEVNSSFTRSSAKNNINLKIKNVGANSNIKFSGLQLSETQMCAIFTPVSQSE